MIKVCNFNQIVTRKSAAHREIIFGLRSWESRTDLQRPGRIRESDNAELDMDWIHPWVGLDWIGSDDCNPLFFFHLYIFYINN